MDRTDVNTSTAEASRVAKTQAALIRLLRLLAKDIARRIQQVKDK